MYMHVYIYIYMYAYIYTHTLGTLYNVHKSTCMVASKGSGEVSGKHAALDEGIRYIQQRTI